MREAIARTIAALEDICEGEPDEPAPTRWNTNSEAHYLRAKLAWLERALAWERDRASKALADLREAANKSRVLDERKGTGVQK